MLLLPTYYQCLCPSFLFQEGPSFNISLVTSLVVKSHSFYLSENYFLRVDCQLFYLGVLKTFHYLWLFSLLSRSQLSA